MMRGLDSLRRAKDRLDGADGDPRVRLQAAAFEFFGAAAEREGWPIGFRIEAESVRAGLLAIGAAEGELAGLNDFAVGQAAAELRSLCDKAERACRGRAFSRPPRPPVRTPLETAGPVAPRRR